MPLLRLQYQTRLVKPPKDELPIRARLIDWLRLTPDERRAVEAREPVNDRVAAFLRRHGQ